MRLSIILFLVFISVADCFCQNRNSVWCFGDSAGIDFKNGTTFTSQVKSRGSCASISDSIQGLLCYAFTHPVIPGNNTELFNGQHQQVINGTNIIGQAWYKELIFIPHPDNDSIIYLFSIGVTNSCPPGLYYSIINYKDNGGTGSVISKNNQLLNFNSCDGLAAIKHGNGRDWWIFYKKALVNNNEVYRFLITPNGVSNVMVQSVGSSSIANLERMTFNHKGDKLALYNGASLLEIFDFDRCTGLLSNVITIHSETNTPKFSFQFAEFSPNDSLLYVSTNYTTSYLYQFKMYAGNIWGSRKVIDSVSTISYAGGDLKLAPDGKIYHARAYYDGVNFNYPYPDTTYNMYNTNLSVINYPDSPGVACNFTPYSFYLGGNRTYWGLPNNPDYDMPRDSGSVCDTIQWTGVQNIEQAKGLMYVTYVSDWQKLFVNAQGVKGRSFKVSVHDMVGNVIYTEEGKLTSQYFTRDLNMAAFAKGMYIVNFVTDKERLVKKFIKD